MLYEDLLLQAAPTGNSNNVLVKYGRELKIIRTEV